MDELNLKKKHSSRLTLMALLSLMGLLIQSCSAPEDDNPGYCRLSCDKTSLAANDFQMTAQSEGADFQCAAEESVSVELAWLIKAPFQRVGGSAPALVERSGIGFDVKQTADGAFKIVTPQSEWCSDVCGVATVVVSTTCSLDKDNSYSFSIKSGAAASDSVNVKLKKPAA